MPVTYSHLSFGRPSHLAEISDTDQSIILSDLVRSGEVSRLRRRGAIAIRDSAIPQLPIPLTLPLPPAPPTTSGISHTDDEDAVQQRGGFGSWFSRSRLSVEEPSTSDFSIPDSRLFLPEVEPPEDEDEDSSYVLFCGGKLREHDWRDPSNSPLTLDSPVRRRVSAFRSPPPTRRPSYSRARRTNGCGMIVHLGAQPRRRQGTWVACGAAAGTVVRLDSRYFDCCATIKMIKSACGCTREGVGCRICGNPLGIIYVPCQAAAGGLSIPGIPSSPSTSTERTPLGQSLSSMHLPSPNYWPPSMMGALGTCHSQNHTTTMEIYNFFSESVRSAPEFIFPPPSLSEDLSPQSTQPSTSTVFERPFAASTPVPLTFHQWRYGPLALSADNIQASISRWGDRTEQVGHNDDNVLQDGQIEGDNAEKPEDSGSGGVGQIPWAEL
ncbi:hypothetical protein B0F90DRAFT_1813988 [Multifurca ochricompacta]|uniref:Uncharacterized protein n=1 Tax=Multifurca ochricompacta TaxID=376703 RepID=A0AAD4MBB9_9AGAM|nr:hypothetical protein B0F90DRAFT_1813988 [Multifurca ochricompacta]